MNIQDLIRPNIRNMQAYSSAREEFTGSAQVYLDANELPYNSPYNRYPDPFQIELKEAIAASKPLSASKLFLGNGSDEAVDLLYRAFCEPSTESALSLKPSYGMYKVSAAVNNVAFREVSLNANFSLSAEAVLANQQPSDKLLFICSPNNPTGNAFDKSEMLKLVQQFKGIVVIDEAYVDFSEKESMLAEIPKYPNLVVLQTLSKSYGLAGLRVGMAWANEEIIAVLNKIKPPYNVNSLSQRTALAVVKNKVEFSDNLLKIRHERARLVSELDKFTFVEKIHLSDANFLVVRFREAIKTYQYLAANGVIVRNRSTVHLMEGCLRISVGSSTENSLLLQLLGNLENGAETPSVKETEVSEPAVNQRIGKVVRKTNETDIRVTINLDGTGKAEISTGLGFFDHMLQQIAVHGKTDLSVKVTGDLQVDEHHTIEDTALALGEAFAQALGNKKGIARYGFLLPMDDCLAQVAIDFGGRPWLVWDVDFTRENIGDTPTEMFMHFFKSFSDAAKCNLNIKAEGGNEHHKIEGVFKAFARAIRMAVAQTGTQELPSSKGVF